MLHLDKAESIDIRFETFIQNYCMVCRFGWRVKKHELDWEPLNYSEILLWKLYENYNSDLCVDITAAILGWTVKYFV